MEAKEQEIKPILLKFAPAWKRVVAFLIDSFLMGLIVQVMFSFIFRQEYMYIIEEITAQAQIINQAPPDLINGVAETGMEHITGLFLNFMRTNAILMMVVQILINGIYFILFWTTSGQTIGSMILKIVVIDIRSRKLGIIQSALRFLMLALASQIYYIPMVFTINPVYRQRFHDFFTNSVVVEMPSFDKDEKTEKESEYENA